MRLKSILLGGALAAAFLNTPLIAPNILNCIHRAGPERIDKFLSIL